MIRNWAFFKGELTFLIISKFFLKVRVHTYVSSTIRNYFIEIKPPGNVGNFSYHTRFDRKHLQIFFVLFAYNGRC